MLTTALTNNVIEIAIDTVMLIDVYWQIKTLQNLVVSTAH